MVMFIRIPLWGWSFTIGTEPTDSVGLTRRARVKLNSALGYLFASRDLDFEKEEFTGTPGDEVVEYFTEQPVEETTGYQEAVMLISRILKYGSPCAPEEVISGLVQSVEVTDDRPFRPGDKPLHSQSPTFYANPLLSIHLDYSKDPTVPAFGQVVFGKDDIKRVKNCHCNDWCLCVWPIFTDINQQFVTGDISIADDTVGSPISEENEVNSIFIKSPAINKFRLTHGGQAEQLEDAEMASVNSGLIANARVASQGPRTREEAAFKSIEQRGLIAKARESFPKPRRATLALVDPKKSRTARRRKTNK
jgi:hypothetical protein